MEHVELVIKIPEDIYNEIKEKHSISLEHFVSYTAYLTLAVEYGTQLPEGHGDIVDLNEMINAYWDGNYMEIDTYDLPNIPVIIEADKGEEE